MLDALIVILRYAIGAGFAEMVRRGWVNSASVADLSGASLELVVGVGGWLATVAWALWRSRLKAKVQDVLAHADISTIHASPALVQQLQVPGVVATPPAQP